MAPVQSVSAYFEKNTSEEYHHRSSESQFRGEYLSRCSKQILKGARLESFRRSARRMFNLWGSPGVDLMATVMSRKAPMFFAWNREDPEAWGQDSLARDVDWTQFSLPYCFPPFPLVGQVLAKVRDQEVDRLILVAPWWPTKPWFSTLINMMLDCRRFRFKATMITDMASGQPPPDNRRCHACLISLRNS